MKTTIALLLTFLFFIGCATNSYQPPCQDFLNKDYTAVYFPIDEGNKWEYSIKNFDEVDRGQEYVLELCGQDTINYYKDSEKLEAVAFKVCRDGDSSQFSYFVKCADGAYLLSVNNWYHKELQAGWLIPNSPEVGEKPTTESEMVWRGQEVVRVPAGEYQTWVLEELRELSRREMKLYKEDRVDKTKAVKSRYYFAEGVGLVKTELYGAPGELISVMEMTDYDIKQKRGGEVR